MLKLLIKKTVKKYREVEVYSGMILILVKVKVKLSLSFFLSEHYAMKTYWGSGSIAPNVLGLGTRWR
jgi:hypothetical protein